jgi:hypothetical protein
MIPYQPLQASAPFLRRLAHHTILQRSTQIALALWVVANGIVLVLAQGFLPFDRPALADQPFAIQVAFPSLGMILIFVLMGVVYLLTLRRKIPDLAARAPERRTAARETRLLVLYGALGQAGGWILGPALGYRPFSFHIAGTVFGCNTPVAGGELWTWAIYNFVIFAAAPYLWFRRRYSAEQLNLRSADRGNDLTVIVVVLVIESVVEFTTFPGLFSLSTRQILIGAPVTFFVFFIGTVLPTMVLIYAILLPRYMKLTGSIATTVLLGGLTYAAMHLVEGWSVFATPQDTALSLIFVVLTYLGPGMFKSFLTLRTGNAWVHVWAYHAFAPHVTVDTPLIVKTLGIR